MFKRIKNILTKNVAPPAELQSESLRVAPYARVFGEHPAAGLTPARAATLLRDAEIGNLYAQCLLAEDMEERDAHLQSELSKRRRALQSAPYVIKPPPNATSSEKADTEMLRELFTSFTWFDNVVFDATDAILKGFSLQEIEWSRSGSLILPESVDWIDPARFQSSMTQPNRLALRDGSVEGIDLAPLGWVEHRAKSKSGYVSRIGLVRTLIWPFIFRNYSARDMAEFLEAYGLPVRIGRYPAGATNDEKKALLTAIKSVGHNAGGIMPAGMSLEIHNASDGGSEPFLAMIDWAERSMSKAILGGTLTSQADGKTSTNALGAIHNDVRIEVRDSDAKQLAATLTRDLILPLYLLNCKSFRDASRHPVFEFDLSEPEDASTYATALPPLVSLGMKIPISWVHDKLQIPQAIDDEPVLTVAPLYSNDNTWATATLSAQHEHTSNGITKQDNLDLASSIDSVINPVLELLKNENDLNVVRKKIALLYTASSDDELEDILARAIFAYNLWGRINAEQE